VHSQRLACRLRFGHAYVGSGRERRWLAIGEVNNPHLITGVYEHRQRAAAGDLDIVRMGPDGDTIELQFFGHRKRFINETNPLTQRANMSGYVYRSNGARCSLTSTLLAQTDRQWTRTGSARNIGMILKCGLPMT
jgi:hypothetical protein